MMISILSMAVFGLSELVLEIVFDFSVGPVDLGVSYFVFIPITLAALFAPAQVALLIDEYNAIFNSFRLRVMRPTEKKYVDRKIALSLVSGHGSL